MIVRGAGAIVNVSSVMALSSGLPASSPLPSRAVYVGTKAFVLAFTEALGVEVADRACRSRRSVPRRSSPSFTPSTASTSRPGRPAPSMTPEAVVQASLAALRLGDAVCVPFLDDPALVSRTVAGLYASLSALPRGTLADRYQ